MLHMLYVVGEIIIELFLVEANNDRIKVAIKVYPSLNAFPIIGEPGHIRTTPHYIRIRNNLNSLRGMHTSEGTTLVTTSIVTLQVGCTSTHWE